MKNIKRIWNIMIFLAILFIAGSVIKAQSQDALTWSKAFSDYSFQEIRQGSIQQIEDGGYIVIVASIKEAISLSIDKNGNIISSNKAYYLHGTHGEVKDDGVMNVINGLGKNIGDPNSNGYWNGKGEFGDLVFDISNDKYYSYNGTGWMVLN